MSPEVYAEEIAALLMKQNELASCNRTLEARCLEFQHTVAQIIEDRDAWRNAFQQCTPMGSEFMTPDACLVYVQVEREEQHRKIVKLTNKLDGAMKQLGVNESFYKEV